MFYGGIMCSVERDKDDFTVARSEAAKKKENKLDLSFISL
jgi:hypothetical protein